MNNFKIGDVVYIVGQPAVKMTIESIDNVKTFSIKCIWFDAEDHIQLEWFSSDILVLYMRGNENKDI